jgi:serine/threonine protein kinase
MNKLPNKLTIKVNELEKLCNDATKQGCKKPTLNKCDVTELGSGNFGMVKKCVNTNENEYAVKMVKNLSLITKEQNETEQINLVNEAIIMINIGNHPNIIKIMGVNVSAVGNDYNISLLLEICNLGSLKSKLLDLKKTNTKFDIETLHKLVSEISNGMAYLDELNIVHNDLATRNILLSSIGNTNFTSKISDFGLARKLNEIDSKMGYTIDNAKIQRPILWLSPEALLNNMFSTKSDVWSFGILLYEIGIYGEQPSYKNKDGTAFIVSKDNIVEFKKMLINGLQHTLNDVLPKYLADIMYSCWKLNIYDRPSFKDIINKLTQTNASMVNLSKKGVIKAGGSVNNTKTSVKNKRHSVRTKKTLMRK